MSSSRPLHGSSLSLQNEIDCYEAIQRALSQNPLTQETIDKAQKIYDDAMEDNVWNFGELGCSLKTHLESITQYREDAFKLIRSAEKALFQLQKASSKPASFSATKLVRDE